MLNPVKLLQMQNEAKQMQQKLREKKIIGESKDGNIKVKMNLAQEFEDLYIADFLLNPQGLDMIRKGFDEAFKDYQKKMQKEAVKDFDFDQLKRMLG